MAIPVATKPSKASSVGFDVSTIWPVTHPHQSSGVCVIAPLLGLEFSWGPGGSRHPCRTTSRAAFPVRRRNPRNVVRYGRSHRGAHGGFEPVRVLCRNHSSVRKGNQSSAQSLPRPGDLRRSRLCCVHTSGRGNGNSLPFHGAERRFDCGRLAHGTEKIASHRCGDCALSDLSSID